MGLMLGASSAVRSAGPLQAPEDVFLSWLLALPRHMDPSRAAEAEIARLSSYAGSHPGPARLLELFRTFRRSLDACDRPMLQ